MTKEYRQKLYDRFWSQAEPDLNWYSKTIQQLLGMITDEQLRDMVVEMEDDEDDKC